MERRYSPGSVASVSNVMERDWRFKEQWERMEYRELVVGLGFAPTSVRRLLAPIVNPRQRRVSERKISRMSVRVGESSESSCRWVAEL